MSRKKKIILGIMIALSVVLATVLTVEMYSISRLHKYQAQISLGGKYLQEMDFENAIIAYENAINIYPKKPNPYLELSQVYEQQGEYEKAIAILEDGADKKVFTDLELIDNRKKELQEKSDISKRKQQEALDQKDKNDTNDESEQPEEESDEWKNLYLAYITENGRIPNTLTGGYLELYKLVDINNDKVPELYINYGTTAGGDVLCSIYEGQVITVSMWNYGFSYIEGENLFLDAGGHMDVYFDKVYSIQDGKFVLEFDGEYGAADNSNVVITESGPVYEYSCNGEPVSGESEYKNRLHQIYDESKATNPYDGAVYDQQKGRYVGNELCDYQEMINLLQENTENTVNTNFDITELKYNIVQTSDLVNFSRDEIETKLIVREEAKDSNSPTYYEVGGIFEGNGVYRISYFENHAVEVVWEYREGEWDAERESGELYEAMKSAAVEAYGTQYTEQKDSDNRIVTWENGFQISDLQSADLMLLTWTGGL